MKFLAILACHNRRETTLTCLRSLQAAASAAEIEVDITIYDDGSTDGTSQAIRETVPDATILVGDGSAFWASGMATCEQKAMARSIDGDYLLWLNDGVILDIDSLSRLLLMTTDQPGRVLVGAMRDPSSSKITYAGFRRVGWHPLKFELVEPSLKPVEVDAFNGNLVAVPVETVRLLGGIDGNFAHAFADIDFGQRLKYAGQPAVLAHGTFGFCELNDAHVRGSLWRDWALFRSQKGGGNFDTIRHYFRKHSPRRTYLIIAYTYAAWWAREISSRMWAKASGNT